MTQICGKWLKYMGNGLQYLTNGLNMFKLTQRFWEMAKIFGEWFIYMRHGKSILGTA